MHQDELTALIGKTSALMEQFERRCIEIEKRQQGLSHDLQTLAGQVPAAFRQSADNSLQLLSRELLGKLRDGLEQPVAAYEQRLREAGVLLGEGSQILATQLQRMQHLHRHLMWKTTGVALASLLLLVAGGTWLSTHYYRVIGENQVAAGLLKAYNAADVVVCEGRLCANVDRKGSPRGDKGQYLPVKRR
jgi:hypothetical protein